MNDERKIKALMSGILDGSNKRRTHREWCDEIIEWGVEAALGKKQVTEL